MVGVADLSFVLVRSALSASFVASTLVLDVLLDRCVASVCSVQNRRKRTTVGIHPPPRTMGRRTVISLLLIVPVLTRRRNAKTVSNRNIGVSNCAGEACTRRRRGGKCQVEAVTHILDLLLFFCQKVDTQRDILLTNNILYFHNL